MISESSLSSLISITEKARNHFRDLLKKEEVPGLNLRLYVANPRTALAEVGITFCAPGEEESGDIPLHYEDFQIFVESQAKDALKDASIDYVEDELGGSLSIKAPNLKGDLPSGDSPLSERVQYVLDFEINPNLAGHGGRASLVEILEGGIVVLRFGGGCHGCGMASVTLKMGIEKTLKERFPEIKEVRDITDHSTGENPYY